MQKIESKNVEYIIIHHSNKIFDHPFLIKLRHKFIRKWDDIGYHFVIGNGVFTKNGKLFEGRKKDYVGAHCLGYNDKSIGIALIGNFNYCKPTFKQYRTLMNLIQSIKKSFPEIKFIIGHNEVTNLKNCPGFFFPLYRFKELVKRQLNI